MARTHFETLRVYQLSEELADEIWRIVGTRTPLAQDTVGKQIVRAADSIGANIAEGSGKGSSLDQRRFSRTARGSLYETKHWLRRAFVRKLLSAAQTESLKATIDNLTRALNGYLRALNHRATATQPPKRQNLKPKT